MPFLTDYPQIKVIQDIARRKKTAVYLVGGFLRDYVLDSPNTDFDFAVAKDALKIARLFAARIKGAYVLLDKERGCARVVKKDKKQIWTFDFADFRARTFLGDLAHRDFTINTLAVDLLSLNGTTDLKEVLLDHKKGARDIRSKKIKRVSTRAFKEDPLRMLRAFALSATLGFKIEPETLRQIKKERDLLQGVSYERIRDELFKVFESDRAGSVIKMMDRAALLEKAIPQIRVMYNCKQGTYHHLDVWPHSLEVLVQLEGVFKELDSNEDVHAYLNEEVGGNRSRRALLKLAALLHDIGKPQTRKREKDRLTFHAHERVGKGITTHVAKMLKLSTAERRALEEMVLWHLRPGYLSNFKSPSEKSIYRYFRDTGNEAAGILILSLADQRATRGPLTTEEDQQHHQNICLSLLRRYFDKKKEKPFVCLVNGNDLIRKLHLKPSPLFGVILAAVAEQQTLGKLATKQEALALAGEIARKAK